MPRPLRIEYDHAFYVAISRARFEARVYTDDRAGLPVAIGRENEKFSAIDLRQKDKVSRK